MSRRGQPQRDSVRQRHKDRGNGIPVRHRFKKSTYFASPHVEPAPFVCEHCGLETGGAEPPDPCPECGRSGTFVLRPVGIVDQ